MECEAQKQGGGTIGGVSCGMWGVRRRRTHASGCGGMSINDGREGVVYVGEKVMGTFDAVAACSQHIPAVDKVVGCCFAFCCCGG